MKRLIACLWPMLSVFGPAAAQTDNPLEDTPASLLRRAESGLLSREQARHDLDALVYTLSEVHPDMFHALSQDRFFKAVEQAATSLPDSLTTLELYRRAAPLVAMLGDGHTNLHFPFNDVFTETLRRLPLAVSVMPDYTLRVRYCIDNLIPAGAEVLSVGGVPAREMLERMTAFEAGERDFFRLERVNGDFAALFQMLYAADAYDVAYRADGERTVRQVRLEATTTEEIRKRTTRPQQAAGADYSYSILPGGDVAVMDFRRFADAARMEAFADSMFTDLRAKGIRRLVIDIRENGGGNSAVGDALLRYLSPRPFAQMSKVVARVTPTTLRLTELADATPGWYYYDGEESSLIQPRTPEEGHYDGEVYLLTSHHTFSSAASFAWAFKQFGMGTVVGEETGGMNVCFGDVVSYRLPVSGLTCSISYKRFYQYGADDTDIHGTLPDVAASSAEALDTAVRMARSERRH